MLHVRDCPGTTSNLDVCPFPWCRKVKHLLYHLVSCTKPQECAICTPPNLTKEMRALTGLNEHRLKKQRERMIAAMKSAAARPPAKAPTPAPTSSAEKSTSTTISGQKHPGAPPAANSKLEEAKPASAAVSGTSGSATASHNSAPVVPTQVRSGPVVTVINRHAQSQQSASTSGSTEAANSSMTSQSRPATTVTAARPVVQAVSNATSATASTANPVPVATDGKSQLAPVNSPNATPTPNQPQHKAITANGAAPSTDTPQSTVVSQVTDQPSAEAVKNPVTETSVDGSPTALPTPTSTATNSTTPVASAEPAASDSKSKEPIATNSQSVALTEEKVSADSTTVTTSAPAVDSTANVGDVAAVKQEVSDAGSASNTVNQSVTLPATTNHNIATSAQGEAAEGNGVTIKSEDIPIKSEPVEVPNNSHPSEKDNASSPSITEGAKTAAASIDIAESSSGKMNVVASNQGPQGNTTEAGGQIAEEGICQTPHSEKTVKQVRVA